MQSVLRRYFLLNLCRLQDIELCASGKIALESSQDSGNVIVELRRRERGCVGKSGISSHRGAPTFQNALASLVEIRGERSEVICFIHFITVTFIC